MYKIKMLMLKTLRPSISKLTVKFSTIRLTVQTLNANDIILLQTGVVVVGYAEHYTLSIIGML